MNLKEQLTQDLEAAGHNVESYVFPDQSSSFIGFTKGSIAVEMHFDKEENTLKSIEIWDSTYGKAIRVL